jgi:hypothetical protein
MRPTRRTAARSCDHQRALVQLPAKCCHLDTDRRSYSSKCFRPTAASDPLARDADRAAGIGQPLYGDRLQTRSRGRPGKERGLELTVTTYRWRTTTPGSHSAIRSGAESVRSACYAAEGTSININRSVGSSRCDRRTEVPDGSYT